MRPLLTERPVANTVGVYAIEHVGTGQRYIGSGRCIYRRWADHIKRLRTGHHHAPKLQALWNDDGLSGFAFRVVELCSIDQLVVREQAWLNAELSPLNASRSARCPCHDPAVAAKMSQTCKGRRCPAVAESNRKRRGETRVVGEASSQAQLRSWQNDEIRMRRREGLKRALSDPVLRRQRSERAKQQWANAEIRAKMLRSREQRAGRL